MEKNERVIGKYKVTDCEHYGDIDSAKNLLVALGCSVISSYWDGVDCGEAFIEFSFPKSLFPSIYKKLSGSSVYYDCDINSVIAHGLDGMSYTLFEHSELKDRMASMSVDYSIGFEERLPLLLFFGITSYMKYKPCEVIEKVLSFFNEPVSVVGYSTNIVDGSEYCNVLIESSYLNLTDNIMKYGIGDFCLGNDGWLSDNGIYGECKCVHKFLNSSLLWGYENLQRVIMCIQRGLPLEYRNQYNYYYPIDIVVDKDSYLSAIDMSFKPIVEFNGKEFKIKDPRKWDWKRKVYVDNDIVNKSRLINSYVLK